MNHICIIRLEKHLDTGLIKCYDHILICCLFIIMIYFPIIIEKLILFIQERVDQEQKCVFISFIVKKEIIFPEEIDSNRPFANSRFDSKIMFP